MIDSVWVILGRSLSTFGTPFRQYYLALSPGVHDPTHEFPAILADSNLTFDLLTIAHGSLRAVSTSESNAICVNLYLPESEEISTRTGRCAVLAWVNESNLTHISIRDLPA